MNDNVSLRNPSRLKINFDLMKRSKGLVRVCAHVIPREPYTLNHVKGKGNLVLSTQLIVPNYPVILSH